MILCIIFDFYYIINLFCGNYTSLRHSIYSPYCIEAIVCSIEYFNRQRTRLLLILANW